MININVRHPQKAFPQNKLLVDSYSIRAMKSAKYSAEVSYDVARLFSRKRRVLKII